MVRVKPTTILTPRVKPTTEYTTPRDRSNIPLTCDNVNITCDSTLITCDMVSQDLWPIVTLYNTPRKIAYLETENGLQIFTEDNELILLEAGVKNNIIQTIWN